MNAFIEFFNIGSGHPTARITIKEHGKPDQIFNVTDVYISDDVGAVNALVESLNNTQERELH